MLRFQKPSGECVPDIRRREQTNEVAFLIRAGWPSDQACEVVGIPQRILVRYTPGLNDAADEDDELDNINEPSTLYVPTPEEIDTTAAAIRSGEVVISESSARRWRELADAWERSEAIEAERLDTFTLAGELPEDAAEAPSWLNDSSDAPKRDASSRSTIPTAAGG